MNRCKTDVLALFAILTQTVSTQTFPNYELNTITIIEDEIPSRKFTIFMLRFTSYTNPIAELSGKQEGVFNEMNNISNLSLI